MTLLSRAKASAQRGPCAETFIKVCKETQLSFSCVYFAQCRNAAIIVPKAFFSAHQRKTMHDVFFRCA